MTRQITPFKRGRAHRTYLELLEDVEETQGVVAPAEVLMLCVALRSHEKSIVAQRVLLEKLGRENAALRKRVK